MMKNQIVLIMCLSYMTWAQPTGEQHNQTNNFCSQLPQCLSESQVSTLHLCCNLINKKFGTSVNSGAYSNAGSKNDEENHKKDHRMVAKYSMGCYFTMTGVFQNSTGQVDTAKLSSELVDSSNLSVQQKELANASLTSCMASDSNMGESTPHYALLEKAIVCSYEAMAKNGCAPPTH